MLTILFWIGVLIFSLIILVKGADWFTQGAEEVGFRFGMSSFLVGVTIVGIGTSLPELSSSIVAVLDGTSDIVLGTVIGSNIANILFVLGLAAIVGKGLQTKGTMRKADVPLLIISTIALGITMLDGVFTLIEAIIFFILFIAYMVHMKYMHPSTGLEVVERRERHFLVSLAIGFIALVIGAEYLISSITELSELMGISTAVFGATIIALGTSLPEAVVSIVAIAKGRKAIALGNIIGSCVFNVLFVTSVAAFFGTLVVDTKVFFIGLPILFATTILLWILTRERNITRNEGITLLTLYIAYVIAFFW